MFPNDNQPPQGQQQPPQPQGGGQGQPMQVPPEFAQHIDPNNQFQMTLLQRIDKLTPQDGQAISTGISPAAVAVLKKVLPEIGFMLDMIAQGHAPGGAPQSSGGQQPAGGAPAPMAPPSGIPRPASRLANI